MKKHIKYCIYVLVVMIFIVFNLILINTLSEEKITKVRIKPKIVLVCHVYTNPYWQYVKLGAEKAGRERNAVIDFEGPDTANAEEGTRDIDMAGAAKVSGIITYVQDENLYKPVINKVVKAGIPLVTVDSDAENSNRLAYVGTDNVSAGVVGAEEMIRQIGRTGKVGIIMGGRRVKNQIERVRGFSAYLKNNSQISISEIESSDSYLLESELAAKKILMNNRDIKAFFCTSALDGQGTAKAVIENGLKGKVKIVCFDDLPETLGYIASGVITATVVQRPYIMGYKAVNIIMDNLEGKHIKGVFLTDVFIVNNKNVLKYEKEQGDYNNEKR